MMVFIVRLAAQNVTFLKLSHAAMMEARLKGIK
jgi:hypothetical protein